MIESVMLTENDVVDCVVSYLKSKEFIIDSMCNTMQKGIDIVANKNGKKILVEAKGATTSKDTNRKGKAFSRNQINSHISRAVFKALQMKEEQENAIIAIALPYTKNHLKIIKTVKKQLNLLDIIVIWFDGLNVLIDGNNKNLE
ncbi:hypothetical protein QYB42_001552 [Clostridium perfringens]|nr:hypothetical protein [Clostridium perfringens]